MFLIEVTGAKPIGLRRHLLAHELLFLLPTDLLFALELLELKKKENIEI
jgi:hypothetical protein